MLLVDVVVNGAVVNVVVGVAVVVDVVDVGIVAVVGVDFVVAVTVVAVTVTGAARSHTKCSFSVLVSTPQPQLLSFHLPVVGINSAQLLKFMFGSPGFQFVYPWLLPSDQPQSLLKMESLLTPIQTFVVLCSAIHLFSSALPMFTRWAFNARHLSSALHHVFVLLSPTTTVTQWEG